jgi:hypothetical protein
MVAIANPASNEDVQQEFDSLQPSVGNSATDAQTLLLSFIRLATIRAKLVAVDLDIIGIALKQGLISLDGAVAWLDDVGLFEIVVQRRNISEGGRQ